MIFHLGMINMLKNLLDVERGDDFALRLIDGFRCPETRHTDYVESATRRGKNRAGH